MFQRENVEEDQTSKLVVKELQYNVIFVFTGIEM